MSFELPANNALTSFNSMATLPWLRWFNLVHQTITAARQSGPTSDRPSETLWIGRQYFDTTLGKPVYVKSVRPTVWVDAAGTTV